MPQPNNVLAMAQDRLPLVSELYFDVADNIAGGPVARDMIVSGVDPGKSGGIILPVTERGKRALSHVEILWMLAGMENYHRSDREISRRNVGTVAHLGGYAIGRLSDDIPEGGLSPEVFGNVHKKLVDVHVKLWAAHISTVRSNQPGRQASRSLMHARGLLMGYVSS